MLDQSPSRPCLTTQDTFEAESFPSPGSTPGASFSTSSSTSAPSTSSLVISIPPIHSAAGSSSQGHAESPLGESVSKSKADQVSASTSQAEHGSNYYDCNSNGINNSDDDNYPAEDSPSILHYHYQDNTLCAVQTFVTEAETPSPILAPWTADELNLDYLTPYHPSHHKSVQDWSQHLWEQIRQKSNSASVSSGGERFSVIEAAAQSVNAITSVSALPPTSIEKHTVIQSHRLPAPPADPARRRQGAQNHKTNQQQQKGQKQSLDQKTRPAKPSKRHRVTRSMKEILQFFKRLLKSLTRDKSHKNKDLKKRGKGKDVHTYGPSDPSLNYLSVSEDDSDSEDQHPSKSGTETGTGVGRGASKDKDIKDSHQPLHENDVIPREPAGPFIGTSISATIERRRSGPKMHPTLLELYTITDNILGVGTFATVKEIKLKSTGKSYALKIILKSKLLDKAAMLETEISVLSRVRHPNCVSLLEMFETEDAVYLVTDMAAGGELFDQLLKKGYYTEGDAARLVREILLGVEYLHSLDIVHRDLKPENLLFADTTESARLMITDFGLSKVLTNGNDVLMTACGTPGYVAPEVLEQVGHGKPVDIWSVGVIAYTLLCGYTPFWGEDQSALFENIMAGEYLYEDMYWKDVSPLAKAFIDSLLVRPADKRSTATHALSHPWFRAMLDQDLSAPASPSDSVNLLPAVRRNFDARNVFKKAARAVGILRRVQGGGGVPNGSPLAASATDAQASVQGGAGAAGSPSGKSLKFQDVVNAALFSKKGAQISAEGGP
ncbi:hypothetical protein EMPS_01203 [Entomortierella parvispora]|uniref:Protein kinase domain-containing protein n=1 Tax=Entomortierella parvispora TaxID=205924 RepID=A0A9P3LSK0_9FUNG|nr:hypothetical protein EMPS_01203 [Entomortierella parvispora]